MDYLKMMKTVNEKEINLNISTITMIGELSIDKIDLKTFYDYISQKPNLIVKYSDNNKDFIITKRGKIKKSFFNQVTINYKDITKKSIKIFLNGKIQVTGIVAEYEFELITQNICKWLKITTGEEMELISKKIGMINSNFNIRWCIDLFKMHEMLDNEEHIFSRYEPDTYPAINMKYTPDENIKVSMFIFNSGNVVITGAKSIKQVEISYEYITSLLTRHKDALCTKVSPVNNIKNDVIVHGYSLKQLLSTIYV